MNILGAPIERKQPTQKSENIQLLIITLGYQQLGPKFMTAQQQWESFGCNQQQGIFLYIHENALISHYVQYTELIAHCHRK